MLIDWFTVGAQILNFLVLVWLLRRYLYQPILQAIDARERRIANDLAEASARSATAEALRVDQEARIRAFDEHKDALLADAIAAAKRERDRLVAEARSAGAALQDQQAASLRGEREMLGRTIGRQASDEVFAIARKVLDDLSTVSLEERMSEVFTRRLREMEPGAKAALGAALKACAEPARVRSRFEMPAGPRTAIQNALNETFAAEVRIVFDATEAGPCGIELNAGGQRLAWSIANEMRVLERKVDALLESAVPPAAAPGPAPSPASTSIPPNAGRPRAEAA